MLLAAQARLEENRRYPSMRESTKVVLIILGVLIAAYVIWSLYFYFSYDF